MKSWIDLNAQVSKHVGRGLALGSVSSQRFAMFLYSSNYYRVSGYGRCFYTDGTHTYQPGTTASTLMDVYDLDRRVRNAVLDGVSVVEPSVRSRVAYQVSKSIGAGAGYLADSLYLPVDGTIPAEERPRQQHMSQLKNRAKVIASFQALASRDELFTAHHVAKGQPVPLWAGLEVFSIGTFSRFLRALRDKSPLTPVASSLGFEDTPKFLQAMQNIAFLRNIAAHHGRLWNRRMSGHVALPQIALKVKRGYLHPQTPAAAMTLLAGMVDQIENSTSYSTHLLDLVHSDPTLTAGYYRPRL